MNDKFTIVVMTTSGQICENFGTYEEAVHRIESLSADTLLGVPMIYQDLPDGSQRVVREDGKPLQMHRLPYDEPDIPEEPLPISEEITIGQLCEPRRGGWDDFEDDDPIPLIGDEEPGSDSLLPE